ncbi:MAG TPA: hypothetical protein VGL13_17680 [Polyangiaceae bacterium]
MRSRRFLLAPILLTATLCTAGARAADKSPDAVRAQALFDEARKLMNGGDFGAACPKFAESQALDPAPGTALNLANCYEKAGKLASAWATYRTAEAAASSSKQKDRATFAKKKAASLEPKLSHLTITVTGSSTVTVQIQLDDQPVLPPEWGMSVPRDGGSYTVSATAPDKQTWTSHIELKPSEQNLVIEVPALPDAPAPEPVVVAKTPVVASEPTPVVPPSSAPGKTQRTTGYVVGGLGIAGLGTAGVMGLIARSQYVKSQTSVHVAADSSKAFKLGNEATVVGAVGGALLATGVVLWLTAPRGQVAVGTNGTELLVSGSF